MTGFLRRTLLMLLLPAAAAAAGGCHPAMLVYPFAPREAVRDVKAQHHLTAERLLILPYLAEEVEFENPTAGTEIAYEVYRQIDRNLRGRVHRVVRPPHVTRYQQSTLDWPSQPVAAIGRKFEADKVLYLEISRFSLMEERSANLYRGRIYGRLQVVDTSAPPGKDILYETEVGVEVPDDRPIGAMEISEGKLRWATMERFAEEVIGKFYDHEEKIRGAGS